MDSSHHNHAHSPAPRAPGGSPLLAMSAPQRLAAAMALLLALWLCVVWAVSYDGGPASAAAGSAGAASGGARQ